MRMPIEHAFIRRAGSARYSGQDSLEQISWEEWFEKFDENDLALVYQDETADGDKSNLNKLVKRSTIDQA